MKTVELLSELRGLTVEDLRQRALDLDERVFRPVERDEFYDRQLIGLRAMTPDGVEVGMVSSVLHLPAQDVLEVDTTTGIRLVPFVDALVPQVDLDAGHLTIVDVAGLLDDRDDGADED